MNHQIEEAIEGSILENGVPILVRRIDTQEWVDLVNGLADVAEDWVRITGGDSRLDDEIVEVREYWGTDDDGDEWRIHVHATR